VGEYFVLDKDRTVAVSTLASITLAEALAQRKPHGLAIVGKTETENIGLD
jgi:tetrahydromethanopterin S-methyltransferase subunit A